MPITLQPNVLKYKDPSNGEYVGINILGGSAEAINDWLNNHPEATTSVQDGSISYAKLSSSLQEIIDDVVLEKGSGDGSVQRKSFTMNGNTYTSTASGAASFATGFNNIASGSASFAVGSSNTASGAGSHAEGNGTTASGVMSHAEGQSSGATGRCSHVEGQFSEASGNMSHVEGYNSWGRGFATHVQGKYNVADLLYSTWTENTSYVVGDKVVYNNEGYKCKTANSDASFTAAKWDKIYNTGDYAFIVGNGMAGDARSNAYALDWDGNGHFAGDVYVGCNSDSTGGSKLVKESDILTGSVVNVSGTTPAITALPNHRYVCEVVSTISFTPSEVGTCEVRFACGSTPAVLTLPSNVVFPEWFDYTELEADTIYDVMITDEIYGCVMSWHNNADEK